jgi:Kef-type K+ transport system membrane component KefB
MPARTGLILALASVVGWFVAALFIRWAAPLGWFDGGTANVILFAVSLPVAFVTVELVRRFVPAGQVTLGCALLTTPALVLDGLALTWTPALYGNHPGGPNHGSTWLLYGVGAILAVALWRDLAGRRP